MKCISSYPLKKVSASFGDADFSVCSTTFVQRTCCKGLGKGVLCSLHPGLYVLGGWGHPELTCRAAPSLGGVWDEAGIGLQ